MDLFEVYHALQRRAKLATLYVRRILFAKNHFHTGPITKLRANLGGGFLADQWALYELDGKKKKEYLSEFDWYRSRYINAPFDYLLNNKVLTTQVLGQYVRMPEIYYLKTRDCLVRMDGGPAAPGDVLRTLEREGTLFIKPIDKGKGNGVERLHFDGTDYWENQTRRTRAEMEQLFDRRTNWYLSEAIRQHDYAASLYDRTLNTIRVITLRSPKTQRFEVFFAVQRVGTSATIPVDNASQGGLICRIDLETGRLSHAKSLHTKTVYEEHPDSHTRFDSVCVPDWPAMKAEVLALAEKLPYMHFVAWDIIKMPDGRSCVIEANTSSGVNIIQIWGGQRQGELGEFYRSHGVIR